MDMALLKRAAQIAPRDPVTWAALAYRSCALLANRVGDELEVAKEFSQAVDAWRGLAPDNSAPLYLKAALACLQTNIPGAKEAVVKAAKLGGFEGYETALKMCIVRALESVGYSRYTARVVASGNSSGVVAWSRVSKTVMGADPSDEEIRACLVVGSRVSGGKSFLEQLVGDSIQKRAMEKRPGGDFDTETERIARRKESVKRAAGYLDSARTGKVTENEWVEYYNKSFAEGEMEAVRALARLTGDRL
jgi:hypothetical protein